MVTETLSEIDVLALGRGCHTGRGQVVVDATESLHKRQPGKPSFPGGANSWERHDGLQTALLDAR